MRIEAVDIESLRPAAYNPRKDLKPGDIEYEKLKVSILEFDYIDPVIWNERTGNVVGGHQRLKVMRELGHKKIDVSVVDLDDAKEKALNIALNKNSGEWDFQKLSDLLIELDTGDFNILITGFDTKELQGLLAPLELPGQPDGEENEQVIECPKCGHRWKQHER